MFIDRLLDDWNKYDFQGSLIRNKAYPSDLPYNFLYSEMRKATAFNIQSTFDYFQNYRINMNIDSFPNVKAVYDISWFEYNTNSVPYYTGISKIGVLVTEHSDEKTKELISIAVLFTEGCDGMLGLTKLTFNTRYSKSGLLINSWFTPDDLSKTGYGKTMAISCIPIWLALSFLHCKNVIVQSTEPSLKLQKARERRGKLPLFTFKTLEIKPMTKILREEGESETKGLAHALHICRGHFKDFQQGPGLGKNHAHGLYWWDSQVRGNRQVGAVIKDYKVSPMGEKQK